MSDNTFSFSEDQWGALIEWADGHECPVEDVGAIGGRISYTFTPTGLGVCQVAKCACGAELDVTEYGSW